MMSAPSDCSITNHNELFIVTFVICELIKLFFSFLKKYEALKFTRCFILYGHTHANTEK
jgi:hypothetical protein